MNKYQALLLLAALAMTGCESQDGPIERAGEKLDDGYENVSDGIRDTADAIEDAADKVDDQISK